MNFLQNHQIISSTDLDEVRESIASIFAPHEFAIEGRHEQLHASVAAATCGDLRVAHVAFGDVKLRVKSSEENADGLVLYLVTSGSGVLQHVGRELEFSAGDGYFRDLAAPISAREEDFGGFAFSMSKGKLKNHARSLIGEAVDLLQMRFELDVDFTTPGGRVVLNTIHYIANALDNGLTELDNPVVNTHMQDLLFSQLLTLLPNSYQDICNGRFMTTVVPYHVKRAREYIHGHADQKLGIADLATATGCSYRALQRGFMDAYGTSPMAYVRIVRLKRIRALLLRGQGDSTITDIAKKWGFAHMGRFAQAYYQEFGEYPSETVRKRS